MKVVIFGATGMVGQRVAKEALARGHDVTGVVRDPDAVSSPDARMPLVRGDATSAASIAAVAKGADAVVNAISPRPNGRGLGAPSLANAAHAFIAGLPNAGVKRLLIVGGAGTLEVAPGVMAIDTPNFPAEYKAEALEGLDALTAYRASGDALEWTYISPAAAFDVGERTGHFRQGGDQMMFDGAGMSFITVEDYAIAMVDELENKRHIRERISVAY